MVVGSVSAVVGGGVGVVVGVVVGGEVDGDVDGRVGTVGMVQFMPDEMHWSANRTKFADT